jgi:hypothetical protein
LVRGSPQGHKPKLQRLRLRGGGHCQTNLTGPAKGADLKRSGCKLTPLNQGSSAVLLEDIATVEVTVVVEVIVDRGMGSGKLLESFHVSELRHRSFSSSERLVGILSPIVEPPTALLIDGIAHYFHCRTVGAKPVSHDRTWIATGCVDVQQGAPAFRLTVDQEVGGSRPPSGTRYFKHLEPVRLVQSPP